MCCPLFLGRYHPWRRGEFSLRKPDCIRPARLLVPALLVLLAFTGAAGAREDGARLVSSAGGAVTFEVTVPGAAMVPAPGGTVRIVIDGYGTFSPPGAVELPGRTFRVAVPQLGEPRVSVTVLEEERLGPLNLVRVPGERFVEGENGMPITEQYYPPDPWANGGGLPLFEALAASFMGRQRILPIRINPLVVDAGGARLVRKLSVTVSFGTGRRALRDGRSRAKLPLRARGSGSMTSSSSTPATCRDSGNRSTGRFDSRPRRRRGRSSRSGFPKPASISCAPILSSPPGFRPGLRRGSSRSRNTTTTRRSPISSGTVDVPVFFVEGAGTAPGVFDGSDRLYFYSLGLKDDAAGARYECPLHGRQRPLARGRGRRIAHAPDLPVSSGRGGYAPPVHRDDEIPQRTPGT